MRDGNAVIATISSHGLQDARSGEISAAQWLGLCLHLRPLRGISRALVTFAKYVVHAGKLSITFSCYIAHPLL